MTIKRYQVTHNKAIRVNGLLHVPKETFMTISNQETENLEREGYILQVEMEKEVKKNGKRRYKTTKK